MLCSIDLRLIWIFQKMMKTLLGICLVGISLINDPHMFEVDKQSKCAMCILLFYVQKTVDLILVNEKSQFPSDAYIYRL